MILHAAALTDFRCFSSFCAEFSPSVNVIVGRNGVGKTSLLEAVFFLSAARSMRTAKLRELVRSGASQARIAARFTSGGLENTIDVTVTCEEKRTVTVGGARLSSLRQILGILPCVLFSAEDLELLRGGAAERRRFLDIALCQIRPKYVAELSRYRKLLAGKTAMLRQGAQKPSLLAALPEYNAALAETGATLARYRAEYVGRLAGLAPAHHAAISDGRESLELHYRSHALDAEETLKELETRRDAEIAQGRCLVGAHRDDIDAKLDGKPIRAFGSQGQVRTAALSLKLAERDILCAVCGEPPVLLLDDVLSELDETRQRYILHRLDGGQVLITCCQPDGLTSLPDGKNILVEGTG